MKLTLDSEKCQGYGLCFAAAPELVDLDGDGYAELLTGGEISDGQRTAAHEAVAACPARALAVGK